MTRLLNAALDYVALFNWLVFPLHTPMSGGCSCGKAKCPNAGKHPRSGPDIPNGFKSATRDRDLIKTWWKRWPGANIGVPTGQGSGFITVDIDPRHGGDDYLADLEAEHGRLPDTVEAITGGGGRHILFQHPGFSVKTMTDDGAILPGVEIKADGGYIDVRPFQTDRFPHAQARRENQPEEGFERFTLFPERQKPSEMEIAALFWYRRQA